METPESCVPRSLVRTRPEIPKNLDRRVSRGFWGTLGDLWGLLGGLPRVSLADSLETPESGVPRSLVRTPPESPKNLNRRVSRGFWGILSSGLVRA